MNLAGKAESRHCSSGALFCLVGLILLERQGPFHFSTLHILNVTHIFCLAKFHQHTFISAENILMFIQLALINRRVFVSQFRSLFRPHVLTTFSSMCVSFYFIVLFPRYLHGFDIGIVAMSVLCQVSAWQSATLLPMGCK